MKRTLSIVASILILGTAFAGEAGLTKTYQPLNTGEKIEILPVLCYDWNALSGLPTYIYLIDAANKPPFKGQHSSKDINLASIYGISFSGGDVDGKDTSIVLDATRFVATTEIRKRFGYSKEEVTRASLECLRRNSSGKLAKLPVTLECKDEDRKWLEPIVKEYNEADHSKPFFKDAE